MVPYFYLNQRNTFLDCIPHTCMCLSFTKFCLLPQGYEDKITNNEVKNNFPNTQRILQKKKCPPCVPKRLEARLNSGKLNVISKTCFIPLEFISSFMT